MIGRGGATIQAQLIVAVALGDAEVDSRYHGRQQRHGGPGNCPGDCRRGASSHPHYDGVSSIKIWRRRIDFFIYDCRWNNRIRNFRCTRALFGIGLGIAFSVSQSAEKKASELEQKVQLLEFQLNNELLALKDMIEKER